MSTDTLVTLGFTVAGLIAFALVMRRRVKAAITARGSADRFQVKGFQATINSARNEVHIFVDDHRAFCAPIGHLVVEHKVATVTVAHEKKPQRIWSCLALPTNPRRLLRSGYRVAPSRDWAETVWTAVETGRTWVQLRAVRLPAYYARHWADWEEEQTSDTTDRMDVPMPNVKARAFQSWLENHKQELCPDRAAVRATWDQACAELLRACRQQRDYRGSAAGAFETWSFSAQPAIAYLVIEADGAAFWASGDTPMLEPVERPRFRLFGERLTILSGDESLSFPLPADRMAALQTLHRKGVVPMDRARLAMQ